MHIYLIVVTPDRGTASFVEQHRGSLVPSPFRDQGASQIGGHLVEVSCFDASRAQSLEDFLDEIASREEVGGVVLFVDQRLIGLVENLTSIFLVERFTAPDHDKRLGNFFGSHFSRALKNFRVLHGIFSNARYVKMMLLPIRNFRAPEIELLCEACRFTIDAISFSDRIERVLKAIGERQTPKKRSRRPTQYLVDDASKYFEYGHEHHALAETGDPHNRLCRLSGFMRFGHRYDARRHYNVSMEKQDVLMVGNYPNCHSEHIAGGNRSHLNMFPNDFF